MNRNQLTEGLCAKHGILVAAQFPGRRHHGQAGADALIAAAGGAHHGQGGARHASVRRRCGIGADILGQGHFLHGAALLKHPAHTHTVVLRKALLRDGVVHGDRIVQEADAVQIHRGRKLINAHHVQIIPHGCAGMEHLCLLMLQHLIVQLHMGDVGMRVLDDAHGLMPVGVGMRLDVELLRRILGMDMDAARRGIGPRRFAILRRGGGQHLQPIGGTSRNAAERGSDL